MSDTPLTDAEDRALTLATDGSTEGWFNAYLGMKEHACDLERGIQTLLNDLSSDEWWAAGAPDHWTEEAPTIAQMIRDRIRVARRTGLEASARIPRAKG